MSNFDRAVKTLNDVGEYIDYLEGNIAYVTALEAAGLLMPDLPEPEIHEELAEFGDEEVLAARGTGKVRLYIDDPRMSSESARELALMLLAACDYAEKEQGNVF